MKKKLTIIFADFIPMVFGLASFIAWVGKIPPDDFICPFLIGCVAIYYLKYNE